MKKLALLITIFGSLIATKEFLIFMENQIIKKYNEINKHNNKFLSKNTINLIAIGCIVNAISALIAFIF